MSTPKEDRALTLAGKIALDEVEFTPEYAGLVARLPGTGWWKCLFIRHGKHMTVHFQREPAPGGSVAAPDAAGVLGKVLSDAVAYNATGTFARWCEAYGQDPDSPAVALLYRQAVNQTGKLRRFLGPDYDAWTNRWGHEAPGR